jgi:hypothetical protein
MAIIGVFMKKLISVLAVVTVLGIGSVTAQTTGPLHPGVSNIGISYANGSNYWVGYMPGLDFQYDYYLPFANLFIGGEAAVNIGHFWNTAIFNVPLMARFGWHYSLLSQKNLDLYAVGKVGIGFAFGGSGAETEGAFEIPFGVDVGVRYFFTQKIGAFLEVGYDYSMALGDKWGGFADSAMFAKIGVNILL